MDRFREKAGKRLKWSGEPPKLSTARDGYILKVLSCVKGLSSRSFKIMSSSWYLLLLHLAVECLPLLEYLHQFVVDLITIELFEDLLLMLELVLRLASLLSLLLLLDQSIGIFVVRFTRILEQLPNLFTATCSRFYIQTSSKYELVDNIVIRHFR